MAAISVKNLSKDFKIELKEPGLKGSIKALFNRKYKQIQAVKDLSFTIVQGELVGFIGPNGAGKTTSLKMLSGLLYPTSGNIKVLGYIPYHRQAEYLKKISLVMGQKNQLWWDLPAIESFNLNKEIYQIPDKKYQQILQEFITIFDLKDVIGQQVRKLSLGQRMKCELVASLIHTPKILFLDEPTIGLDIVMQKKVREFIREYNHQYNATIILTSHYMDDVKEMCKRVLLIDQGALLFDGLLENLIQKFADYKILAPTFSANLTVDKLGTIGEIILYNPPKAQIKVKRDQTSQKASELLSNFPVQDLEITEPPLEDIVSLAFRAHL